MMSGKLQLALTKKKNIYMEGKRKEMCYLSWTILSTILLLLGESEAFKDAIIIWKLSRER